YDMVKAVDRGMAIGEIRLLEKSGGRSGRWKMLKKERRSKLKRKRR
ncbi:MAG: hypothetical protein HYR48_00660, partial [Gemmatimonadetes bacterium]|nr:hypothetical protein [Gemmatimonadota bacterium]